MVNRGEGERGEAAVVLVVVAVHQVVDKRAEVRLGLPHRRGWGSHGGSRHAGVMVHLASQVGGQKLDGGRRGLLPAGGPEESCCNVQ